MGTLWEGCVCVSLRVLFPRSHMHEHPDLLPTAQMFLMEDIGTREGMELGPSFS